MSEFESGGRMSNAYQSVSGMSAINDYLNPTRNLNFMNQSMLQRMDKIGEINDQSALKSMQTAFAGGTGMGLDPAMMDMWSRQSQSNKITRKVMGQVQQADTNQKIGEGVVNQYALALPPKREVKVDEGGLF